MTQKIAIIGYPLKHTISPAFQQAALDHYGLDVEYEVWEADPIHLAAAIGELRYPQNIGANVTIPYKEEVLNFIDEVDELADDIGAVNTIVKEDNVLVGRNTDAPGFLRALQEDGKFDPHGSTGVIIGAGGAARAVCHALVSAGCSELTLVNRSRERAEELCEALRDSVATKGLGTRIAVAAWGAPEALAALSNSKLIVNCTSMGMKHGGQEKLSPLTSGQIPSEALVFDLVYSPAQTPLLKAASAAGARTLGGLPMLVYQGAAAFEMWTGKSAPLEVMFEAARDALA
ncbi:MAG: shikimate dehydrogenase [Chloroflexi bacterium]|nr:shikimate dehydrogenase [Chloroflexota bacterium]